MKDFDVFLEGLDKTSSSTIEWVLLVGFFLLLFVALKLIQRSNKKAEENSND